MRTEGNNLFEEERGDKGRRRDGAREWRIGNLCGKNWGERKEGKEEEERLERG